MSLDEHVLARLVQRRVGAGTQVHAYTSEQWSPMAAVIQVVEETLGHPVAAFWVDGGLPEMFSLPGLDPPVVVFSTRYLEMIGSIYRVFQQDSDLIENAAERLSLRIIAELALRYGDASTACYLFIESALHGGIVVAPVTLMDMEVLSVDEFYMVAWFYGFLHECGHIKTSRDGLRPTDTEKSYIADLVERAIAGIYGDQTSMVREHMLNGNSAGLLDIELLYEEGQADVICAQLLVASTVRVLNALGALSDRTMDRAVAEMVRMFQVFDYINGCAIVARSASNAFREAPDEDAGFVVANAVRFNMATQVMAEFLSTDGWTSALDKDASQQAHAWILDLLEINRERQGLFNRGHSRAGRLALFKGENRSDVYSRLADHLMAKPVYAWYFEIEAREFLELASRLGVRHPDLDLLAEIAEAPHEAQGLVSDRMMNYRLAWVTGEGVDHPFGVRLGTRVFVLVFITDAIDEHLEHARAITPPGRTIRQALIVAPTMHEVLVQIHHALDPYVPDITVVFEGSEPFVELSQALRAAREQ